jgi:hypothetical protein
MRAKEGQHPQLDASTRRSRGRRGQVRNGSGAMFSGANQLFMVDEVQRNKKAVSGAHDSHVSSFFFDGDRSRE